MNIEIAQKDLEDMNAENARLFHEGMRMNAAVKAVDNKPRLSEHFLKNMIASGAFSGGR